jgi:hypothetical protein
LTLKQWLPKTPDRIYRICIWHMFMLLSQQVHCSIYSVSLDFTELRFRLCTCACLFSHARHPCQEGFQGAPAARGSPRMPLLMPAAAQVRLAAAPSVGHRTDASKFVSSIAVDKFGFDGGWLAMQQCTRSVPLLSDFAFTGSGECSIPPTLQDASPDALRSPACQNPLRYGLLMHTLTCVILVLPSPGVYRCEAAAT